VPAPRLVCVELNPGPRRGKNISEEKKWEIVIDAKKQMKKTKLKPNISQLARSHKVQRNTVSQLLQKYQESGTVHDRTRSGRKRKFSEKEITKVVKKAKKERKAAPELARESKKKVSVRTVRRYLNAGGVQWLRIKKKEKLSEAHKQERVEYAKEMKGYNWNTVLFSDEKKFVQGAVPRYAWQDPNDRIVEDKVPYPKKLNVWGAIGTHVKTKLYFFDENMNSDLYSKVLKRFLKEKNLIYAPKCPQELHNNWVFLQDNAKYHTTRKSMGMIEEMVGDRWIKHPAKSPDLNPMENMWSYLDRKVKAAKPQTIKSLKRTLTQAWNDLTWKYVAKSTESMPRRLQQCIKEKGERLKY
jgi:DNA-binding transcriptional regulator YhcF (GntR family)